MCFITGNKICLREVRESDLEIFQRYRNNYTDSINYRTIRPLTSENQKNYWLNVINNDKHIVFTILEKCTHKVIGEIRISNIDQYKAGEIGLWIVPEERHKGMASESLQLLLEFIFGRANINRIEAQIASTNKDSVKFFTKNQFKCEGILREATYYDFKYQNVIIMSMLKQEYIDSKEKSSLKKEQ